jgi:hypothetical protein
MASSFPALDTVVEPSYDKFFTPSYVLMTIVRIWIYHNSPNPDTCEPGSKVSTPPLFKRKDGAAEVAFHIHLHTYTSTQVLIRRTVMVWHHA